MGSFTYTSMMIRAQARYRAAAGDAGPAGEAAERAPAALAAPSPATGLAAIAAMGAAAAAAPAAGAVPLPLPLQLPLHRAMLPSRMSALGLTPEAGARASRRGARSQHAA